jgi:hypothetical protein
MANQKEKCQPESWAIEFVSMVLSKGFQVRHFINTWNFLRNRMLMRSAPTGNA